MKNSVRALLFLTSALSLSACQQPSTLTAIQPQQLNQLSALVAGANWTRDYCQRNDIPQQQVLLREAMNQAKQRGWNTTQIAAPTIAGAINQRYEALNLDNQTTPQKCAALNIALAPFLQQITLAKG